MTQWLTSSPHSISDPKPSFYLKDIQCPFENLFCGWRPELDFKGPISKSWLPVCVPYGYLSTNHLVVNLQKEPFANHYPKQQRNFFSWMCRSPFEMAKGSSPLISQPSHGKEQWAQPRKHWTSPEWPIFTFESDTWQIGTMVQLCCKLYRAQHRGDQQQTVLNISASRN